MPVDGDRGARGADGGESVKPALSRCSMPTARCWMRASSTAPVRMMATAGGARIRCRRAFQHSQRRGRALGTDPPAAARAHGGCGSADLFLSYFTAGICRTVPRRDDERREDVAQALGARVPPFSLTQEAPVVVRASRLRSGRRMYWCGWAAGIVALAALWLTFSSVLSQMVAQIAGQG